MNTSLGETWEEQGDAVEMTGLMARAEEYTRADLEGKPISGGVDVQKDRLEASFVAWGPGEEAWLVEHIIIPGDTARPEPWAELARVFGEIRPVAVAVDSGFNTSQVYEFVAKHRYCYAIKGQPGFGRPLVDDARKRAQRLRKRRGVHVDPVGVDGGKQTIHARLRQQNPGAGYIHFPVDDAFDDEYFAQLTAEKLITRYRFGRPHFEWQQVRPRNEALDCLVYALAAIRLSGMQLAATSLKTTDASPESWRRRRVVSTAQGRGQRNEGLFNLR